MNKFIRCEICDNLTTVTYLQSFRDGSEFQVCPDCHEVFLKNEDDIEKILRGVEGSNEELEDNLYW